MIRQLNLNEVTDGKKYYKNDMAKLGCNDCEGCSRCCSNMGESIFLDPWDIYMLTTHLEKSMEELLEEALEWNVVEGLILPNMRLAGNDNSCPFLSAKGRCSIHDFRPGVCRLFPLGRVYEGNDFYYVLQTKECHAVRRTKVKVSQWLGIRQLDKYEQYISKWHELVRKIQDNASKMKPETLHKWNMYYIRLFFMTPYDKEDFYGQFALRYETVKQQLKGF